MPTGPGTDAALLEAWRQGDAAAGSELLRRHFRSLYHFFFNKVADVDDLVQTTMMAAVERHDQIRDSASFRAYLLTIARRQLVEHWRRRGRIERVEDLQGLSVTKLGITPSRLAATRQQERRLLQALRTISVDHQTVLELFYWQELSVAELSSVLDVAPGTIKSRLARARAVLAERLEQAEAATDAAMHDAQLPTPDDGLP